jgi:hypothetical protein
VVEEERADLARQLMAALLGAVEECKRIGYNPTYFTRMLAEHGAVETARRLITAPAVSDGFTTLWERGRLDLSVEAMVQRPEFAALFTPAEVEAARRRLRDFGYEAL